MHSGRDRWLQTKEGQDSFLLLVYAYSVSDDEQWNDRHVEITNSMLRRAFPEDVSVNREYGILESEEEFNDRCDRCNAGMAELNKQWRNEDNEKIVEAAMESVRKMNTDVTTNRVRDVLNHQTRRRLPRHVFSLYGGMNWGTGHFNSQVDRRKFDSGEFPDFEVPQSLDEVRSDCKLTECVEEE